MNDFETNLFKFVEEADSLQKRESQIRMETQVFNEKLNGFLKENGLPDNFTLPGLAMLCIRKSRDLIKL